MPQRSATDTQDSATDPKFYLPVGITPSFLSSRVESVWSTLFSNQVEPPQ